MQSPLDATLQEADSGMPRPTSEVSLDQVFGKQALVPETEPGVDLFEMYPLAAYYESLAHSQGSDLWQPEAVAAADSGLITAALPTPVPELANTPIGEAKGLHPGRVAWVRDAAATNWDGASGYYWTDDHTNQDVVRDLMGKAIRWLAGEATGADAWNALFAHFNLQRGSGAVGYAPGEKIVIKANLNESTSRDDADNYADLTPATLFAVLDQLVNVAHVPQEDITVYDSIKVWSAKLFDRGHAAFPGVHFVDRAGGDGREQVQASDETMVYWSDGGKPDQLPTCVVEAKYMINLSIVKKHELAGISGCGKNHYGSLVRTPQTPGFYNLHNSLPIWTGGRNQYRAVTDLMAHEHLGGKTMLYLLDGIWGGWLSGSKGSSPTPWVTMDNHWLSSLFASQDPVAIDSVMHDFLRAEEAAWMARGNPPYGDPGYGSERIRAEADDYLHAAAQLGMPGARLYAPNGDGTPAESLGVHEHWNNDADRHYSRNLQTGFGIELVRSDPLARVRPSVAVTGPVAGSSLPLGQSTAIVASTAASDDKVNAVDFYVDGILAGRDGDPTDGWSLPWKADRAGLHQIAARAIDSEGVAALSAPVTVAVGVVVTVEAVNERAAEPGSDTGTIIVRRTGETALPLSVRVTIGGSATGGTDYKALDSLMTIPAGADHAWIQIAPIDDAAVESGETVVMTLAAADGYIIGGTGSATVTLVDDDVESGTISGLVWNDLNGNGTQDEGERGQLGWTVYVDENENGLFDTYRVTSHSAADLPRAIPDHDTAGVSSELLVSGLAGSIADVNLMLSINHPRIWNLQVYLTDPAGVTVQLLANLNTNLSDFVCAVLDDQAYEFIAAGPAYGGAFGDIYTDRFRPVNPLSVFNGHDPNGVWKLTVVDNHVSSIGTLIDWSLRLSAATVVEPHTTTHQDGRYMIAGLPAGTHKVRMATPAAWQETFPAGGGHAVVVANSKVSADLDFGIARPGSSFPSVFNGSSAEDRFYLRLDPSGRYLEIFHNVSLDAPATYRTLFSAVDWLNFDLKGGGDQLTVDLANGSPVPAGGLHVDGGGDEGDTLLIQGSAGHDEVTVSPTQVSVGGSVVTFAQVRHQRVALGAGRDTLNARGGSLIFPSDASLSTEHLTLNLLEAASVLFEGTQHLDALNIGAGSIAALAAGGDHVLVVNALSVADGGRLDLGDNSMILRHGDGDHGVARTGELVAWVLKAAASNWIGDGITSSAARAESDGHTTLAVFNNDTGDGAAILSIFGGHVADGGCVFIKYTRFGDLNLDGRITGDDYALIDVAWQTGLKNGGWLSGDINYDGEITGDDYALMDAAWQSQGQPLAPLALEPAAVKWVPIDKYDDEDLLT